MRWAAHEGAPSPVWRPSGGGRLGWGRASGSGRTPPPCPQPATLVRPPMASTNPRSPKARPSKSRSPKPRAKSKPAVPVPETTPTASPSEQRLPVYLLDDLIDRTGPSSLDEVAALLHGLSDDTLVRLGARVDTTRIETDVARMLGVALDAWNPAKGTRSEDTPRRSVVTPRRSVVTPRRSVITPRRSVVTLRPYGNASGGPATSSRRRQARRRRRQARTGRQGRRDASSGQVLGEPVGAVGSLATLTLRLVRLPSSRRVEIGTSRGIVGSMS